MEHNGKQELLDRRYLRMARIWAENSYCERRKVGALMVKERTIISDGFNGTPAGFENVCEDADGLTKTYVVYSELYRITDGIDLLKRAGVECCHIADAGPLSESAV